MNRPITQAELNEGSIRAVRNGTLSFDIMIRLFKYNNFEIKKAKLQRILYRKKNGPPEEFDFSKPVSKELRIDLIMELKVNEKLFAVRLDDCFLIEGIRYLGDGFKYEYSKGFQFSIDQETIKILEKQEH